MILSVEAKTGEEVLNAFATEATDDPKMHCLEDRYCEGRIEELRIEAMGRQIEISPSPGTPPETLVDSCIGLLAAFADPNAASEIDDFVHAATAHVLHGERIEVDLGTFEFTMKLTAEDLPSCKVVRFIQR